MAGTDRGSGICRHEGPGRQAASARAACLERRSVTISEQRHEWAMARRVFAERSRPLRRSGKQAFHARPCPLGVARNAIIPIMPDRAVLASQHEQDANDLGIACKIACRVFLEIPNTQNRSPPADTREYP